MTADQDRQLLALATDIAYVERGAITEAVALLRRALTEPVEPLHKTGPNGETPMTDQTEATEVGFTDDERDVLLRPCACGHTINDHGSLAACWICGDEGGECETNFETLLVERVEAVVTGRLAAHTAAAESRGAERVLAAVERMVAEWGEVVPPLDPPACAVSILAAARAAATGGGS